MNNLLAVTPINLQPGGNFSTLAGLTIPDIITAGLQLILVVAALIFFFILVLGGIKYILSGGDKAQTEAARNQITAALVGLVIVFAAWAIASLISTFFGLGEGGFLNLTIPEVTP